MATHVERGQPWGICPDGSRAESFRIVSEGLTLELLSYGGRVTALEVPDRQGDLANVALGHGALAPYLDDKAFLGCSVGRYANRIARGAFTLGDQPYQVDVNDPPNSLHGGRGGFAHRNWDAQVLADGVEFRIGSRDGDQGFPGQIMVAARYRVLGSAVRLEYEASTDRQTVLNLTNHTYFNLAGEGYESVLDHTVQVEADTFLPIDETAIPLGAPAPVAGTPFDFTSPHTLGERIREPEEQLLRGRGYDHNFVLRAAAEGSSALRRAAILVDPRSGRQLTVDTSQPGLQLYTGNYLDGTVLGRSGLPYLWRSAVCLETQHWPDSPNHPEYPSTVLEPGETFRSTTVWTFGTV